MAEPRHYLSPADLDPAERQAVLARADVLKQSVAAPVPSRLRAGALFMNPSLRTRVSFEGAVHLLGGHCQTLNASTDSWKLELDPSATMDGEAAENVVEAARVLGRYFDLLGVRAFPTGRPWSEEREEPLLRAFARHAGIPVISLEGALHHPCQSLADQLTLFDTFGPDLSGLPVALTWSWHPRALPAAVPHSFVLQAALAGCDLNVVHPAGYELDPQVMQAAHAAAAETGGRVQVVHDREDGLADRQVVYVKSWGRLESTAPPEDSLRGWILDGTAHAITANAWIMHCLPVRRNVVISGELLDGPRSLVVEQAENRLWAQAALIEFLTPRSRER